MFFARHVFAGTIRNTRNIKSVPKETNLFGTNFNTTYTLTRSCRYLNSVYLFQARSVSFSHLHAGANAVLVVALAPPIRPFCFIQKGHISIRCRRDPPLATALEAHRAERIALLPLLFAGIVDRMSEYFASGRASVRSPCSGPNLHRAGEKGVAVSTQGAAECTPRSPAQRRQPPD